MNTHSRKLALLAAISALLLAPAAYAQSSGRGSRGQQGAGQAERGARQGGPGGHQRGPGARMGGPGERFGELLNLTDAQRQQIQALRAEMREDLDPVHEDLQELREQLHQLWSAQTPNVRAINALGDRIDQLQGVIRERQVQFRLATLNVLTPEQRAQAAELGPRGGRGFGQGGHEGGPGMGGGRRGRGEGMGPGMGGGRGGRHGMGDEDGMGRGGRLAERLGLDEAQRQQIQALRQSMQQDLEPVHEQLGALRERLHAAWSAEQPDEATILALGNQMDALQRNVRTRRVLFRAAMLNVLTPEQRAQAAELGPRGGRGFGPGHGEGREAGPRGRGARQGANSD